MTLCIYVILLSKTLPRFCSLVHSCWRVCVDIIVTVTLFRNLKESKGVHFWPLCLSCFFLLVQWSFYFITLKRHNSLGSRPYQSNKQLSRPGKLSQGGAGNFSEEQCWKSESKAKVRNSIRRLSKRGQLAAVTGAFRIVTTWPLGYIRINYRETLSRWSKFSLK